MVKCLPEFEYFYCILENRKFISKIKRSKVTDYAALNGQPTKKRCCTFTDKCCLSHDMCPYLVTMT